MSQVRVKVQGLYYTLLWEKYIISHTDFKFACTNNVVEFEALILGLENAINLGFQHLTMFGDSELVVNLTRKIYNPSNKSFENIHTSSLGFDLKLFIF
jgi:ribonuclease HI